MTRVPAAPLFLVALALASGCAAAQDLAQCLGKPDKERLACYDALAGRKPDVAPAESPQPSGSKSTDAKPEEPPHAGWWLRASERKPGESLLGKRWGLDKPAVGKDAILVDFHNANYFIGRYSDHVDDAPRSPTRSSSDEKSPNEELPHVNPAEAKFQISFKARMWAAKDLSTALWLGYTQQSHWQIGNAPLSRPFRESDYQPEIMLTLHPDRPLDGRTVRCTSGSHEWCWRLLNFGLVHQSNGRGNPLSRSWNRVYAQFGIERGDFAVLLRPWYRLPESSSQDDMPDIHRYYGSGDVVLLYKIGEHTLTFTGRGNPRTGFGAAQLEWSSPKLLDGPFRLYVQAFSGYGESLIDYNWRQNTIGIGLSLSDAL